MQGAQWSSAVPARLGCTSHVLKWKGLQYPMCGTVQCVKRRVQKVGLNLGQGKQEAGSWLVRVLLQETFSGPSAVKRSRTDLWGNKDWFDIQILQEEACDKNHLRYAKNWSQCSCFHHELCQEHFESFTKTFINVMIVLMFQRLTALWPLQRTITGHEIKYKKNYKEAWR